MTTAAVAKQMGRQYITIERDTNYCLQGQKRLDYVLPIIGDIEKATFDNKPPKVSFEEMITAGYFVVGEKLYYANSCVVLQSNGKILNPNNQIVDIHSSIALLKNSSSTRLNGWDYWQVKRNDKLVPINDIRQQYIKEVKSIN